MGLIRRDNVWFDPDEWGHDPPTSCNYCGKALEDETFVYFALVGNQITFGGKAPVPNADPDSIEHAMRSEAIAAVVGSDTYEAGPCIYFHWKCAAKLGSNLIGDSALCRRIVEPFGNISVELSE